MILALIQVLTAWENKGNSYRFYCEAGVISVKLFQKDGKEVFSQESENAEDIIYDLIKQNEKSI